MSTDASTNDSPSTATGGRAGYVWVDAKDGVAAHWERERAHAEPPAAQPEPTQPAPVDEHGDHDDHKKHKKHKKHDKDHDDDDDHDHDHKKHKKHDKDHDDEDHDHKKHKKDKKDDRDEDANDDADTPPATTVPPPVTPTPPPGQGPIVRDHRSESADAPGGVTVSSSGPTVRDHRDNRPPPEAPGGPPPASSGPTVRDHRDNRPPPEAPGGSPAGSSGATVRDHRTGADADGQDGLGLQIPFVGGMSAASLDEFAAQVPTEPAATIRDHRDQPDPAEVRDHRDGSPPPEARVLQPTDDIVGDEATWAPSSPASDLAGVSADAFDADFQPPVSVDDGFSSAVAETPFHADADLTVDAFADADLHTDDISAFALDTNDQAAEADEFVEQLD